MGKELQPCFAGVPGPFKQQLLSIAAQHQLEVLLEERERLRGRVKGHGGAYGKQGAAGAGLCFHYSGCIPKLQSV